MVEILYSCLEEDEEHEDHGKGALEMPRSQQNVGGLLFHEA